MGDETFVLVGGGLASARAIEAIREGGHEGPVVLVSADPEPPYDHPPLSKAVLLGAEPLESAYLHPREWYDDHGVELRLGVEATALDPARRRLTLADGTEVGWDRLLLATGAEPRRLDIPGAELDGVLYLRDLDDSKAIAERLRPGAKLAVIGAGWIGAEVAASARQRGLDVTVIDPVAVPLERVLGSEVGAVYRDIHADHGVRMLLGTGVEAFEGDGAVQRVRTTDGATLDCDFVVVGIGVTPCTGLADDAGLGVDNGILVDEHLQTDAAGVFAAGDVANAHHPLYDERIRVEHWANALNQGPVAAQAMLGRPVIYDSVPYFFSDQYDVGMEYAGHARRWDRVVLRGDPAGREFIAFWLAGDRLLAGMNVNVWGVTDHIQRLIRERVPVDDGRLADPDVPLEDLAPIEGGSAA